VNLRNLAILALFILLTLLLTWPLLATMNVALAGQSWDVYINPWADWWTKKTLSEGLDLYHTSYMFYPQGTSLVFHSFSHANTAISLLLSPLLGRFVAYNFTILLAYALSGFGMYLLVSYLTGCPPAAVLAGLVFAFSPYHIFESAHPVLVTTQWMPLFVLALLRMLYDADANQVKLPLLAAWWFLLTALSSWHLMIMLAGWAALFLPYSLLLARRGKIFPSKLGQVSGKTGWAPGASRRLLLFAVVATLLVVPFLWPIVHTQLTEDTAYVAVDVTEGLGNDLLSFFIPNQQHPLSDTLGSTIYEQMGFTAKRPAYLGYVALGLAAIGVAADRRRTLFWLAAGLLFFFFSLGAQISFKGATLHAFRLPWATPIISVLRHPFRLNVLLFFSLAVLVGFGTQWLYRQVVPRSKPLGYFALTLLGGLLLFEYLVLPFPTTEPLCSRFYFQLAQEEGEFAVADFPMGRRWAKYYLFCQTIHGKKIVDGVVSRTPNDAYTFADADPLLGPLRAGAPPDPETDVAGQFAALADQGIRYIIVHKHFLQPNETENWKRWQDHFPDPFYEDDLLIVYATPVQARRDLELAYEIGAEAGMLHMSVAPIEVTQGGSIFVNLHRGNEGTLSTKLETCLTLASTVGDVSQESCWILGENDEHIYQVDPHLPGGVYTLAAKLVEPDSNQSVGEAVTLDTITVKDLPRVYDTPAPQHVVSATLGQDLRLLGYDVVQTPSDLRVTLYWQAERQMSRYYKFFVHLLESETLELVAQADVVPRDWTYPNTWWKAGEVVSDGIQLSLTDVPTGTYMLAVGVYDPDTGNRLPAMNASDERVPDDRILLPGKITR
jgi:hypothetical protein